MNTPTTTREFTESDLDSFILLSKDEAGFHSSNNYAKSKGFEGRFCHGLMSLMPVSKILGMSFPGEGYVILELKTKFHKPAYPNKKISYNHKIISKNDSLGLITVSFEWVDESNSLLGTATALCKKMSNLQS